MNIYDSLTRGIETKIVKAIIEIESGGNVNAIRYEPDYKYLYHPTTISDELGVDFHTELVQQRISWGPMQIMGANVRWLGCKEPYLSVLCSKEIGIFWGCQYLKNIRIRYSKKLDMVAAYNYGHVEKDKDHNYVNQEYVNRFLEAYDSLS